MKNNAPNYTWLTVWAIGQVLSVVLAMTIIDSFLEPLAPKPAIITFVILVIMHWSVSYGLLFAANIANERPAAVACAVTAALLAVAMCPTEPRMAQTMAATVFLGIVLWQTLLKFSEE